jgi:hypothetical protein
VQGFLLGKPMDAGDVGAFLAAAQAARHDRRGRLTVRAG